MKKFIRSALPLVLIFALLCFFACSAKPEAKTTVYTIKADKTEVSVGDMITFTVYLDCELFASSDLKLKVSDDLFIDYAGAVNSKDIVSECITSDNDIKATFVVASTADCDNTAVFEIDCIVADTVKPGDKLTVDGEIISFEVGTDKSGDETVNKLGSVEIESTFVTVK